MGHWVTMSSFIPIICHQCFLKMAETRPSSTHTAHLMLFVCQYLLTHHHASPCIQEEEAFSVCFVTVRVLLRFTS